MKFSKMHGLGNDYIYVNCFEETVEDPASLSVKLSDRHFGIGGDGLILILPSQKADFRMRMFNADGSEGEMCGNAIRCVGKYVYDRGMTTKTEVTVETLAGIRKLTLFPGKDNKIEQVRVWMGEPKFSDTHQIADFLFDQYPVQVQVKDRNFTLYSVSMGNPHTVAVVSDVAGYPVQEYGELIQKLSIFPYSVNVEFVEVVDPDTMIMRVYERGSGETMACGTGACASAAAMMRLGKLNKTANVRLPGGVLKIEWASDGIYMTGPATHVFDGEI
ncbi:MAG: diaminopimelate epimerase [Clostridiaceae bacterium]|nr:diaminopimelate epimerase [Clostridiaceae bacterium]